MRIPSKIADVVGLPPGRQAMPGHRPRFSVVVTHEQREFLVRTAHARRMRVSGLIRKAVAAYIEASGDKIT